MANGEYILVTENGEQIQIWGSPAFVGPVKAKKVNDYTVHVTPACEHVATIRTVEDQQLDPPMPMEDSLIYPRIKVRTRQIRKSVVELKLSEIIMLKILKIS